MSYSVVLLFGLIFAPLLVQIRGGTPAALFLAAATVYAAFYAVNVSQIQISLSQFQEAEPAYRDTYYVVSDIRSLMIAAIAMAAFGALTWLQTRFGAMRHSTLTKLFFWVLHIALIGNIAALQMLSFGTSKPRRYTDYSEVVETYALITSWSGLLSQAALLGLLCLLLWSITANRLLK